MKVASKLILIFICLLFPILTFAQQNADKPGRIYVSPDGKLFVKSKTPIYLRLAISPEEKAESYILRNRSDVDPSKTPDPFYFEGHGRHSVQHPADHRIPQKNKDNHIFHVWDDGRSPRSKVSVTKAPWVYNGNVNIYGKPVQITIDFTDADSGVFAGYVALNSESFVKYTTPLQLREEIDYKLQYYALDNVSNKSRLRTRYYSLDFTPPETTTHIIGPHLALASEDILSPKSRIALKARDMKAGVKQIRYRFKGKRGVYKNKALTMNGLKDGSHALVYASEDRVKNQEENHTYHFYLDSVPPVAMDQLLGDQYKKGKVQYVSGRTVVELSATDNKAGVRRIRYYINGQNKGIYDMPFGFPKRNGKANFTYQASDKVVNINKAITKYVVVDISPPRIKPRFKGEHYFSRETHYVRLTTKIDLPTTDNLSGVRGVAYQIDETPEVFNPGPFTLSTEGEHIVKYQAIDNVNNETEEKSVRLYVDEKAPDIYHHFSVNPTNVALQIYPLKSLLYLAATDKQAGIRDIFYSINGSKEIKYEEPLSFKKKQSYLIKIRAIDNVGNTAVSEVDFEIQ